ncbi:cytochrome c [Gemmobacter caeni]|uniref:Cytochrome c n=1 Tax=Gemmobacter caeni TaxID=589035 RepID=A0A2T6AU55_9RHOB|nr:cytochrome C [Gemmobacter caeni]PTX47354.1 cytochrome c [Gemmobacter caeni]TWI96466.1 cytochrome c [Gemmobacter caeni]
MKHLILPLILAFVTAAPVMAGDAAKGEAEFKKCKACHAIVATDGTEIVKGGKTGPNLFGVIGRTVGTEPDFAAYGDALKMIGAAGRVWDEAALTTFVADPAAWVKEASGDPAAKSKMTFKLAKGGEDVAAYLASLN